MSSEKMTAVKAKLIYHIGFDKAEELIQEIKSYATQEVEQQTKQLKEERDKAIKLLGGFYRTRNGLYGAPAHSREIDDFLNQLNQQNEG